MSSSSNWLDRLWSSKRPPIDLHPLPVRIPSQSGSPPQQPSNPFTRITHSLSDLFCLAPYPTFPTSSSLTARKFPRKQPNPMHFIPATNSPHLHTAALITNTALNEEEEDPTLDGFSRTEVTVIDTSFAGWKFEKFLFRKDATWKARDKKANKPTLALRKKMIKNKEKKRKSLVTSTENFAHKKLKVLYPGSSACNQV